MMTVVKAFATQFSSQLTNGSTGLEQGILTESRRISKVDLVLTKSKLLLLILKKQYFAFLQNELS